MTDRPITLVGLEDQIAGVLTGLIQILQGDYGNRLPVGDPDDPVDAIHLAINLTAEQLEIREKDQHRSREIIQHLNSVLLAIRNVSQLIIREKDPMQLIDQTSRSLIETGGYQTAWIALFDDAHRRVRVVGAGFDWSLTELTTLLEAGNYPPCCDAALSGDDDVAITTPATGCDRCQLERCKCDHALTARLEHEGKVFGLLSVGIPAQFAEVEEYGTLGAAIARDLAFALNHLEVARQQRAAEQTIRKSEINLRKLFEGFTDGVLLTDLQTGVYHLANRALCRMTGYTLEEIRSLAVGGIHPVNKARRVKEELERLASRETSTAVDIPIQRKDGTVFLSDITMGQVELEGKAYSMAAIRDVTERKKMQSRLAQADRLASLGMLSAGVAHEINNPLTYVLYNIESLLDDMPDVLESLVKLKRGLGPERAREVLGERYRGIASGGMSDFMERILYTAEGARRIRDIVRDLKTFSHVDEERLVSVSVNDALESAINMAFNEIKYRARIVKDYGEVPLLVANDGKLAQVFLNLLFNAAQAIEEGDVANNEIRVRTWTEGGGVAVELSDTGPGIPEEDLDHIFDAFYTTKGVGEGAGLGLAICNNIITNMGGTIDAESVPNGGARFTIRLPVNQPSPTEKATRKAPSVRSTTRGRILIVDDEPNIGGPWRGPFRATTPPSSRSRARRPRASWSRTASSTPSSAI